MGAKTLCYGEESILGPSRTDPADHLLARSEPLEFCLRLVLWDRGAGISLELDVARIAVELARNWKVAASPSIQRLWSIKPRSEFRQYRYTQSSGNQSTKDRPSF